MQNARSQSGIRDLPPFGICGIMSSVPPQLNKQRANPNRCAARASLEPPKFEERNMERDVVALTLPEVAAFCVSGQYAEVRR